MTLSGRNRVEIEGVEQDFGSSIISQAGDIFLTTRAEGNAGSINIQASSLTIDAGTIATGTSAIGNAGNITIDVTDGIALSNFSTIRSNVDLLGVGDGGDINIRAKTLTLEEGGAINASVFREALGLAGGQGTAGNINIETSDSVVITGVFLNEILTLNPVNQNENFVETGFSSGVSASTGRGANGNGGNVTITTGDFAVADGGGVAAITANQGSGGNITINANTLDATGGGQILTTAFAQGNAGNINLDIADSINISGSDANFENRLNIVELSSEDFSGVIEDIVVNQGAESGIFANTAPGSTGEGGNINIGSAVQSVTDVFLADEGRIAANSDGAGDGGNIEFFISDRLELRDESLISAQSSGLVGSAQGNIDITVEEGFVVAFPSEPNGSDILASTPEGEGGNLNITSQGILGLEEGIALSDNGTNDIDVSGEFTFTQIATEIDSMEVGEAPENPIESQQTVAQACRSDRIAGGGGGLTIEGKGGIPPEPTAPFDSDVFLINGKAASPNSQAYYPNLKPIKTSIGDIMPARGVIKTESGEIILTAYPTDNLDRRTPSIKANCT